MSLACPITRPWRINQWGGVSECGELPGGDYADTFSATDRDKNSYEDTSVDEGVTYCYLVVAKVRDPGTWELCELPSNEECLSTCDPPPCNEPSISGWIFTDQGFIAGGQEGAFRLYEDPDDVSASPWSFLSPDMRSFRVGFEDDGVTCSGNNTLQQVATLEAAITVGCATQMTATWSGVVEHQNPGYDLMFLYVDDVLEASAESKGDGMLCTMGAPVSDPSSASKIFNLNSGTHLLRIEVDTKDAKYHVGSKYEFQLSFQPQ